MADITLTVTYPIYINTEAGLANTDILLTVQPPFYIGLIEPTEIIVGEGVKITGVDGGDLGQESVEADIVYRCVVPGDAETTLGAGDGTAVWMKYQMELSTE
jgi:hypothetical protein